MEPVKTVPGLTLNKVSEKVADDQIQILNDYYEIDTDIMAENTAAIVDSSIKNIKKAIMNGRLEITDESGIIKIIQRMKKDPDIILEYAELSGKSKTQIKENDPPYKKVYALMGSLSGVGANGIARLTGPDLSTVESLGTVFLQV